MEAKGRDFKLTDGIATMFRYQMLYNIWPAPGSDDTAYPDLTDILYQRDREFIAS